MAKKYHVIPSSGGKWSVRQAGASRALRTFASQADAVKSAKMAAKRNRSVFIIHGKDGRIRSMNTYGDDPFPPKARR